MSMVEVMGKLNLSTKINLLNLKTKIFFSISSNPTSRGSQFYNKYFKKKNYIYLPLRIKNKVMFKKAIAFFKKKIVNFGGASISMPYKEEIIKYVDKKDFTVQISKNANTVILKKNKLIAFNTDYLAATKIAKKNKSNNIVLIGAGALAKTFLSILKKKNIYIYNRSKKRITKLRSKFNNVKKFDLNTINKIKKFTIINATPCIHKMKIYNYLNFNKAGLIVDCVISSKITFLEKSAKKFSINYINGNYFYELQRSFQKKIYLNEKL
jgi:shikimate dehydrogenase